MLYPIPEKFTSEALMQRFSKQWYLQSKKKRPIIRTLFLAFPKEIAVFLFLEVVGTILSFSNPIIINRVMLYVDSPGKETKTAIFLLAMIFISKMAALLSSTICVFQGNMLGTMVSSALNMKIFDKVLRIPLMRSREYNEGKLVNMIQTDLENIYNLFYNLFSIVILPLQIIIGLVIMYYYVDLAFLAGVAVVFLMTLLNFLIGKLYLGFQAQVMAAKDERIKGSNEMLNRMHHLKINAEEHFSYTKLALSRKKELNVLMKQRALDVVYVFIFWITPVLVIIFTLLVFILMDNEINSVQVLTVYSLFQTISGSLSNLPLAIAALINSLISVNRVEEFLLQKEMDNTVMGENSNENKDEPKNAIVLINGTYFWEKKIDDLDENDSEKNFLLGKKPKKIKKNTNARINVHDDSSIFNTIVNIFPETVPTLKNIDLKIPKNSFIAIVGVIGSGKSSLINAFLNEMRGDESEKPNLLINCSMAYTSQKIWIQNLTIRENILFGLPLHKDKYALVKKMACLDEDLKVLKHGDETMIGDKGINLSGGQKARVSLARALYADKEMYLFDDILAALDPQVSKTIFHECFVKHLKNKTRVLITHNLNYLEYVDFIYVLNEGKITEEGSYEKIKQSQFLQEVSMQRKHDLESEIKDNANNNKNIVSTSEGLSSFSYNNPVFDKEEETNSPLPLLKFEDASSDTINKILDDLILDEDRQVGRVSFEVVKTYLKYNGGTLFLISLVTVMLIWMGLEFTSNYWLTYWTSASDPDHNSFYLKVYAVFSISYACSSAFKESILFIGSYFCSLNLHNKMIKCLLLAPLNEFFDRVPTGRILNRLSKDLYLIDTQLSTNFGWFLISVFSLIEEFGLCFYAIKYWVLIPFFFMLVFLTKIQSIYMKCNRELVRLEAISKSPIVSFFTETLGGLSTIRAFSQSNRFLKQHAGNLNENIRTLIIKYGFEQWFTQRITLVSFILVMTVTGITLFSDFEPGFAGLLLIYIFQIEGALRYAISSLSYVECQLISFERCHSLCKIAPEQGYLTKDIKSRNFYSNENLKEVFETWPSKGEIKFKNVDIKYRVNLNFVLKNLTFSIKSNEKIGIVGRTGAGKSTLLRSLLRIIETSNGKILIDDLDIRTLDLRDLRRRITLIPQDVYLFEGTLKDNLDPNNEYEEEFIWDSLEKVGLKETFQKRKGLASEIKEQGGNLSDGEKQLISLSKAFLKHNKLILIDEVTDNVDLATEKRIIKIIRKNLIGFTVLMIAHRIDSVMDADRVIVLERGEVVEFEAPGVLLENKGSMFYKMWQDSWGGRE